MGGVSGYSRVVVWEGFSKEVTFELILEQEEGGHVKFWGGIFQARGL